jgi:hypothetical protein
MYCMEEGVCKGGGDPHYRTFDDKPYDFMGQCKYYLLRHDNITIIAENQKCGIWGATCTKALTILVRDTKASAMVRQTTVRNNITN